MNTTYGKAKLKNWYGTDSSDNVKAREQHAAAAPKLEAALQILADLGTPEAIAQFLRDEGIRGLIGISNRCPLSNWLRRETGHDCRVAHTVSIPWEGATTVIDCPAPAFQFYQLFDQLLFPDLQEPDKYNRVLELVNA